MVMVAMRVTSNERVYDTAARGSTVCPRAENDVAAVGTLMISTLLFRPCPLPWTITFSPGARSTMILSPFPFPLALMTTVPLRSGPTTIVFPVPLPLLLPVPVLEPSFRWTDPSL